MRGDLSIREVRTGSGAIAVQIIKYVKRKRVVVCHIGSANTDDELTVLWQEAEMVREKQCAQPSLFARIEQKSILHADHLTLSCLSLINLQLVFSESVLRPVVSDF